MKSKASLLNKTQLYFKKNRLYCLSLIIILTFSLITKLTHLSTPKEQYFDEVYHGFTATRYLHGDRNAYDIWARPPEGKAYEWTHPPLAKLIMAGSMAVFGENSFGWRISSVLLGTAAIFVTALIALELTGSQVVSVLTAGFLSVEGLWFVQSRIAMNDAHFLFFMLTGMLFYIVWRKRGEKPTDLLLSGVCMGLALASKWTTIYAAAIIGIDQLARIVMTQKLPSLKYCLRFIVAYAFIPVIIYIITYTQFFTLGFAWKDFIELQKQMWWYHTNLKATHGYQSRPWQWIFDLRPVWMHVNYTIPNKVGNIYNLGNPIIFLGGLAAVLSTIYTWIKKRTWEQGFLLLCYFMFWVPWIFSPRIMFFYHYLPAVPFLTIALASQLASTLPSKKKTEPADYTFIGIVFTAAIVWFAVFYPHLTGLPVPKEFADKVYFFLTSWR